MTSEMSACSPSDAILLAMLRMIDTRLVARMAAGSGISDPSYVFFKESTGSVGGPVGAFGLDALIEGNREAGFELSVR